MPKKIIKKHVETGEPSPVYGHNTGEQSMCYRSLKAFQNVYLESSYNNACINMRSSRRTVVKLVRDLENVLGSSLFGPESDGCVSPSPFGERFFNDMRFLESAMERFMEKVETIRQHRRVLRVGAPALVFRTILFRSHFRNLRSFEGFRVVYVQISSADAGKSLSTGDIDWFFDLNPLEGIRFASEETGGIPFTTYRRIGAGSTGQAPVYKVAGETSRRSPDVSLLEESQWLRWLDHPAECLPGTQVTAPRIFADPLYWEELEDGVIPAGRNILHVNRLRQHPYEFLPDLAKKLTTGFEAP